MKNSTGIKILVVDDEGIVRDMVAQLLQEESHTVTSVESAEDALNILGKEHIQLVITDIRLGGMDGITLLEKIKSNTPEIEVVMMTSFASLNTSIKAIREGAFDYLLKPFDDLNVIPEMVERVVEKIQQDEKKQRAADVFRTLSEEVLNRMHIGVVLVDEEGATLLSNKNAEKYFSSMSGLIVKDGKLSATMPKIRNELSERILEASQRDVEPSKNVGVIRIPRKDPLLPLTLLISPVRNRLAGMQVDNMQAAAIIFISEDKQKIELSPEVLNILYGLTPAESRLTIALVDGLELDKIAEKLNVSLHTLRGYLKNIFKKTGAHRQSELIKLVLTGPAKYSAEE